MADILEQIRELVNQYVENHAGERPNRLRISRRDEWEFLTIPMAKLPDDVAKKLFMDGLEKHSTDFGACASHGTKKRPKWSRRRRNVDAERRSHCSIRMRV